MGGILTGDTMIPVGQITVLNVEVDGTGAASLDVTNRTDGKFVSINDGDTIDRIGANLNIATTAGKKTSVLHLV
jgi:hypothetical protein